MRSFFKKLKNNKRNLSRGFSLLELTVVLAIFAIMTTILIADIPNFREKSSLDLTASEVATYIRGAQVYGAAQVGASEGDNLSYGTSFLSGDDYFHLFLNNPDDPRNWRERYELKGYKISQFIEVKEGKNNSCSSSGFAVLYESNPFTQSIGTVLDAKFFFGSTFTEEKELDFVDVKIASKRNPDLFSCVRVYGNGQIAIVGGDCSPCN